MQFHIEHLYQEKFLSKGEFLQSPIKLFPSASTQIKFQPIFSKQTVKRCEDIFKKIVEGSGSSERYSGSASRMRPKSQLSGAGGINSIKRKGSSEYERIVHSQGKLYKVISIPIHSRATHHKSAISQSNLQPASPSRFQKSSSMIKFQQKKEGKTGLMKILLKQFYQNKKQRVKKLVAMRQANNIQKEIIRYHKENIREDKVKQILSSSASASVSQQADSAHSHNFISRDIRQYHHYRMRNNQSRKDNRPNQIEDEKSELTPWPVAEQHC